jgi:2'-5' RNA ligase
MRCFLAAPVPDATRDSLVRVQEALRRADADVRWVSPESLHLTLKFLGEMGGEPLEALRRRLPAATAGRAPLALEVAGLGAFPDRGAPKVVWAGCRGDLAGLEDLVRVLERESVAAGAAPEERPFAAHLTIGRARSPRNAARLRAALERERATPYGRLEVSRVVLYRSTLAPDGPIYEEEGSFPLGPSASSPATC